MRFISPKATPRCEADQAPLLEAVFEHAATMMSEALERGTLAWPFRPPARRPRFPTLMPNAWPT